MKERLVKILLLLRNNLADGLSLVRIPLGVAIALLYGNWTVGFVLLGLGWLTDPFDGKITRRFGSYRQRHPGSSFDADGIGDFVLEFTSAAVVAIYLWRHFSYGWIALCILALALISGGLMAILMERMTRTAQNIIRINMLVFHGLINIAFVLCWFAYMTFGLPVALMVGVGLLIGGCIHPKPRLWLRGRIR